jgi:hypothetical protein
MTIARFRRRHAEALIGLFSGVLALCAEAGLVRVGLVAIDGTGIRANANKDRVIAEDELAEQARRLLAEAEAEDAREEALDSDEEAARRGLLPAGFANEEERRARLDAAEQRSRTRGQTLKRQRPRRRSRRSRRRRRRVSARGRAPAAASAIAPIPTAASCARAPASSRATTLVLLDARRVDVLAVGRKEPTVYDEVLQRLDSLRARLGI